MKYDRELFMKSRILFIRSKCPFCGKWLEFIERLNLNLPIDKRIKVVNCAKFDEFGIVDHPLILKYRKYIDGYPLLFFEGQKISGANSREELEAFIKVKMSDDFLNGVDFMTDKGTSILFDKSCSFKKTFLGKRVVCE